MIGGLTDTDLAVVAQHAVIDNAGVLENRRGERRRVMADGTILGRRQVANEHTYTDDVVVAHGTTTDDAGVIIYAAGESTWGVTGSAIFGCWHMVARLAERVCSVVAGIAANHSHNIRRVVHECADEASGVMARAAVGGGHRMIEGHTNCHGSVVAGGTGLRHRVEDRVIE